MSHDLTRWRWRLADLLFPRDIDDVEETEDVLVHQVLHDDDLAEDSLGVDLII